MTGGDPARETIGVEGRLTGECQDLAGLDVEHHGRGRQSDALRVLDRRQGLLGRALDAEIERQGDVAALDGFAIFEARLVVAGRGLRPEFPAAETLEGVIERELHAGGAGLPGVPQFLHRVAPDFGDVFDVRRELIGILHVAEHMGGHAAERIGTDDIRFQTDRTLDRKLFDEARDGLTAFVGTRRGVRDGESEVGDERERQGTSFTQVLAQVFDVDLALPRRIERRGLAGRGLPDGLLLILIDDEPDLVEPALQDVDAGELHHAFGVHLHGLTGAFGREQPQVFGTELLLQGGEVGLHAPAGAVIDEDEAVAVVNPSAGGRAQDDTPALVVGQFLEVVGLDQLTISQTADDIEEA